MDTVVKFGLLNTRAAETPLGYRVPRVAAVFEVKNLESASEGLGSLGGACALLVCESFLCPALTRLENTRTMFVRVEGRLLGL